MQRGNKIFWSNCMLIIASAIWGSCFLFQKAGSDTDRRFFVYGVQVVFGDADASDHHRIYAARKSGMGN